MKRVDIYRKLVRFLTIQEILNERKRRILD